MLRTTVSRAKKVCSGVVPRILRRDPCGGPVSYAVVRKALKSTKSTDDSKEGTLASEDNVETKSDGAANLGDKAILKATPTLPASIPLTQREKCQKIIDRAFGPCEHTEASTELTEQYCSHNVDLEETRRKILESEKARLEEQEQMLIMDPLLAERTPYGIYNREPFMEDIPDENTRHPPSDIAELANTVQMHKVPDVVRKFENIEPYVTNAKDKEYVELGNNPENIDNKALHEYDAEKIEMIKDERIKNLREKEIPPDPIHTLIPYSRTQIGVYTLYGVDYKNHDEILLMDSSLKIHSDVEDRQFADRKGLRTKAQEEVKTYVNDLESVECKGLRDENSPLGETGIDEKNIFINATTAKEDDEKLTQKLETIEETPIVEAQIPKSEGFNITPRVLGDQSPISNKIIENNQDNSRKIDLSGSLDDVAKRCLNSPLGKIDQMLLNEIEKRPITSKTKCKTPSPSLLGNMLAKLNEVKTQPNNIIEKQKINCESSKFKDAEKFDSGKSYSSMPLLTLKCKLAHLNKEAEKHAEIKTNEQVQAIQQEIENIHQKINETIATEPGKAIKQEMKNITPLNKKTREAVVTEIHIGIDKVQDSKMKSFDSLNDAYSRRKSFGLSNDAANKFKPTYYGTVYASKYAMDESKSKDKLLRSDYMFKGVRKPTHYGTINPSKYARNESKSTDYKNMPLSHSLSGAYMWGHNQENASAKTIPLQQEETDAIEKHGSTQSQFTEEQVMEARQTTANEGLKTRVVSYNKLRVPEQELPTPVDLHRNKYNDYIDLHRNKYNELDETPQQLPSLPSQEKSKEQSEIKQAPGPENVKVSITDELLREHVLDPYYVLACNETCPISPISTTSTYNNSDFVDTTETVYMKKNICESIRPKPLPKMTCEKMTLETEAQVPGELEDEIIPDMGYPAIPEETKEDPKNISLLKLSEQVSLSELLRRVRERNRLECISDLRTLKASVEPAVGKCNRKAPHCPPTAPRSPPAHPVPPPSFGLPMLKRRPPACKRAKKKKPGNKCTACDMDVSSGVKIGDIGPGMACVVEEGEVHVLKSRTDLTEVIVDRLNDWGEIMRVCHSTLIPSRSFFKTEWTKPKYINKPYTTSKDNTTSSDKAENDETLAQPYIKTTKEIVSELASEKTSKASFPRLNITNGRQLKNHLPPNLFHLNLERLLNPPMASVAYLLVRYCSTNIDGDGDETFWRPRSRIPDENEMIRRLRDPDISVRKKAEKEAKYLFLNYGNVQYVNRKNEGPGIPEGEKTAMSDR
ncbi:hypothetical protein PYW07_013267 [Mythimna separata]|uniref:Uncharacterized protein n=1 Tax=Mythimna separata TaxID=271217 RepID=A0AAD8DJU8_MYTSE|nr:hypothetical protein PYW07_013267 [Mythimna separata]